MNRWTVFRVTTHVGHAWVATGDELSPKLFRTWREAFEFADRRARTREIVLPRPTVVTGGKPQWWVEDLIVAKAFDGNPRLTMTSTHPRMSIPNHLRSRFAAALIAAEEWERKTPDGSS